MLKQEARAYINTHAEEMYQLLIRLAQIPAPSHHEEKRMTFCRDWLLENGAKGVYTDDALNVIYPYGVQEGGDVIVFMAHMDVVFPDTEALPLHEENDRIYCPGVGDDTANLVALLLAAKYVTETKAVPKECGILFVCNSCEEGMGNLKGSRQICADFAGRIRAFYSFDGTMKKVTNRAVGSRRFQVSVRTQGGHSYSDFGRKNAIAALASIVSDIYAIKVPQIGKTTYNVGEIKGGTSVNTIAEDASMLCEFRSDEAAGLNYMQEQFDRIFAAHQSRAEGGNSVTVEVELVGERPCEQISAEAAKQRARLLNNASELLKRVTGQTPKPTSGSTDCNIPLAQGIPAVCYGTYYGAGAHTREEYVEKNSLKLGYEVALESVLQYCKA